MQSSTLETLEKKLTPATTGLIWFSKNSLQARPCPFEELDYFFDGLLSQTAELNSHQAGEHYFIKASQFSRPFYLIFLGPSLDANRHAELIQQDLELIERPSRAELLLIDPPSQLDLGPLTEKYNLKINKLELEH